jgi:integrase
MPRRLLKYVDHYRDRHGKPRYYFRRGKGKRIALPDDPTSEAFLDAYAAAMAERPRKPKEQQGTSLAWLIDAYQATASYREQKLGTMRSYDVRLAVIRRDHGGGSFRTLNRQIVEKVLDRLTPGARSDTLSKLRAMCKWAVRLGYMEADPTSGIKAPKLGSWRSWEEAEIEAYLAHWPAGSMGRLALYLLLYTGQRVSDTYRMTWADLKGTSIRVIQQKTGVRLLIPLHGILAAELHRHGRRDPTLLLTGQGVPFRSAKSFGMWMAERIAAAGLPDDCVPHGLRKAAGRRMAEAGCTAHQIMAILGHKSLVQAEKYTREANQATMAAAAILRLEDHAQPPKGEQISLTLAGKLGEIVNFPKNPEG